MSNYPKIPHTAADSAHKEKFLTDILYRKEFYQYKIDPKRNFRDPNENDPLRNSFLKIQSHQLFCSNFINPNTPYKRLFVMHQTGTGKTLVAISIAQAFIKVFAEIYKLAAISAGTSMRSYAEIDKTTPSVFIFGFTKSNIIREILKFPEFGFITIQERDELDKLQKLANAGMPADVKRYKEFYGNLKRRITNKRTGGFYKFFGYQELVNRLFISNEVNLVDLEIIANQRLRAVIAKKKMERAKKRGGEGSSPNEMGEESSPNEMGKQSSTGETGEEKAEPEPEPEPKVEITDEEVAEASIQYGSALEDIIKEYIDAGKIHINKELLEQFNNSLIICDEVHNIYNSSMKNNYGVAIQYILDYNPNIRAVFLSATPMNNSPTEIVDVLNLLQPSSGKIHKSDLFVSGKQFTPDALDKIEQMFFGRVSFIQDLNPKYMPSVEFIGKRRELLQPIDYGSGSDQSYGNSQNSIGVIKQIPYLVFEQCEMSEKHIEAYIKYLIETEQLQTEHLQTSTEHYFSKDPSEQKESPIDLKSLNLRNFHLMNPRNVTIGTEARSIFDLVYPTGIFKTSEIRSLQSNPNEQLLTEHNIKIVKSSNNAYTIAGDWLKYENVGEYSSKYKKLLDNIFGVFAEIREEMQKNPTAPAETFGRKHMIYHDKVRNSGVLQIQELLKANGFIDEKSEAVDTTICAICGIAFAEHKNTANTTHKFYPARFVMAHSDIDKKNIENSIIKFNAPENMYGLEYWGLVGSKLISEGYDMKDVREFSIMSSPIDISTLRQTLGRCVRKNSHINLMPHQRNVKIRLYISVLSLGDNYMQSGKNIPQINTPDEYRYVDKFTDYYFMQGIENRAYKSAIDADIHFDIISRGMPVPAKEVTQLPPITERELGPIPYRPILDLKPELSLKELNTLTFDAYGHNKTEIKTILYIIKRLFLLRPVWTYADLWEAVQEPPFGVEVNPKLFNERNFIIALNGLISKLKVFISGESLDNMDNLSRFDSASKISSSSINNTIAGKMLIKSLFDKDESYIYGFGDVFNTDEQYEVFTAETSTGPNLAVGKNDTDKSIGDSVNNTVITNIITNEHIYNLPFGKKYKIEHIGNYYILFPVAEKNIIDFSSSMSSTEKVIVKKRTALTTIVEQEKELPIIDIESYIRPINYSMNISIDIEEYMEGMKNQFTYDMQYSVFAKKYFKEKSPLPQIDIIGDYSPEFFHNLLTDIISTEINLTSSGEIKEFHKTKKGKVYGEILSIFDKFKSIIYLADIVSYDDVVKKITDTRIVQIKGSPANIGDNTEQRTLKFSVLLPKTIPIGFVGKAAIFIYGSRDHDENKQESSIFQNSEEITTGGAASKLAPKFTAKSAEAVGWFRLGKNTLGVSKNYVENAGGYVGYYESSADGTMKFKIRRSINSGAVKTSVIDIRFVERGIVCATKGKKEIISVLNAMKLDIDKEVKGLVRSGVYPDISDENGNPKIKYLCKIIELSLINAEIKERQKNSNVKYLYMWYEDPIAINTVSRSK